MIGCLTEHNYAVLFGVCLLFIEIHECNDIWLFQRWTSSLIIHTLESTYGWIFNWAHEYVVIDYVKNILMVLFVI